MTKSALVYAWIVIAVGAAVVASAASLWQSAAHTLLPLCLGLAFLASTFKVKLPGLTGTISPGFVFLLVAIARLSWPETIAVALISGLVQSMWRPKVKPKPLQIAFNVAALSISGGLAHSVSHGLVRGGPNSIPGLGVAAIVLLVTNTLLVSGILCLLKVVPLHTMWRALQPCAVPYYLTGGLIAAAWSQTELLSPSLAVLAAVSTYLLHLFGRDLIGRRVPISPIDASCSGAD